MSSADVLNDRFEPRALLGSVAEQVQALDPNLPARTARTFAQRMETPLWPSRTLAGFSTVCGVLALVLATVGLFGVTYYAVNQRTREFGIRVAIGARPHQVMLPELREGLALGLTGVALGVAAAAFATRLLSRFLYGVGATDPATFTAVALLILGVVLLASYLPSRRALRIDPVEALAAE